MIDQVHYISQHKENLNHIEAIKNALEAGCKWIQLRVKNQDEFTVRDLAIEVKILCDQHKAKLIINDFPEVAKAVNAHGVHLGLSDMSVTEARKIVGEKMIIGGTANTFDDIRLRVNEGADYVGLGPFRFTTTKEKLSPILGLEGYRNIFKKLKDNNIDIPIIAIGGLELNDVAPLKEIGLHGVALSGTITYAEDAKSLVSELYSILERKAFSAEMT